MAEETQTVHFNKTVPFSRPSRMRKQAMHHYGKTSLKLQIYVPQSSMGSILKSRRHQSSRSNKVASLDIEAGDDADAGHPGEGPERGEVAVGLEDDVDEVVDETKTDVSDGEGVDGLGRDTGGVGSGDTAGVEADGLKPIVGGSLGAENAGERLRNRVSLPDRRRSLRFRISAQPCPRTGPCCRCPPSSLDSRDHSCGRRQPWPRHWEGIAK